MEIIQGVWFVSEGSTPFFLYGNLARWMRPDTGQNSKNRDFVIQREFNIMTQRAMILLQGFLFSFFKKKDIFQEKERNWSLKIDGRTEMGKCLIWMNKNTQLHNLLLLSGKKFCFSISSRGDRRKTRPGAGTGKWSCKSPSRIPAGQAAHRISVCT